MEEIRINTIFENYGITVLQDGERFFIEYDSGEIVSKIDVIEVNKEDAFLNYLCYEEQESVERTTEAN